MTSRGESDPTRGEAEEPLEVPKDDRVAVLPGQRLWGAAAVVAALSILSSALGLLRDLSLANLFGASGDTDAFLVAWTLPETATPLLIEGALTYLLIPVFVAELARSGSVTRVVRLTILPFMSVLILLSASAALASPFLVDLLAPGISDRALAVRCFRMACLTLVFMGLAGYLMAALRSNNNFAQATSIFAAYNVGILATMYALHDELGVFSAALGLVVGSVLMVLVQVPQFIRLTSLRQLRILLNRKGVLAAAAFIPIAVYTLGRQSQVFVERVVGSMLGPGAISYMNYASKVAQVPVLLATTAVAVAFPALARAAADSTSSLAVKADQELRQVVLLILPAIAFIVFFADQSVGLIFERGAFTREDTGVTGGVMRLYSLGLLGQVLTIVGAFIHFSRRGRTWIPALAAVSGLLATVALDLLLMTTFEVQALAIGNAAGITVTAAFLLAGVARSTPWRPGGVLRLLLLAAPLAVASAALAWVFCWFLPDSDAIQVIVGSVTTLVVFLLLALAARVREAKQLAAAVAGLSSRIHPSTREGSR